MTSSFQVPGGSAPWSMMPGWGVVADLTPPELVAMRRLKVLRKLLAIGLAAVLGLCVAGYVFAMFRESAKRDSLDATRDQGTQLTIESNKYAAVTRLKTTTDGIQGQISTLMTNEVDVAKLLTDLGSALPNTMSITSMNVTLSSGDATAAAVAAPSSDGAAPAGSTASVGADPTAGSVIGTVTLSGNSQRLADLATYLLALKSVKGITAVVPGSNTAGTAGTASWSMTLSVTDKLLTHKYDATTTPAGGNR